MLVAAGALVLSAALVYWACEYFVNGIEWVGHKAGISQNAVGTVLAAFGTALPESVVTFVAVVFGHDSESKNIGIGAALGGPLVLATVAYPIVGIMLMVTGAYRQNAAIAINRRRLSRDQAAFLAIFACKMLLGFAVFSLKPALGWLFLAGYVAYSWLEVKLDGDEPEGELEPLAFQRGAANPGWAPMLLQTALALAVIFGASHLFVTQLEVVGPHLGIPATLTALVLSPVATELPETLNAVIWIRQGKHRLALSNISGSMMVQATVPTALGLFFTPWIFDGPLAIAAAVTLGAVAALLTMLRCNALTPKRLALVGFGYALFAVVTWLNIQVRH